MKRSEWQVIQGDARVVLAVMPAESVQCVVTSPPYWGLRDYGLPALIWGGDPKCLHGELAVGDCLGETYRGKTRWNHVATKAQEQGVAVRDVEPEAWVGVPTRKRGHPGELSTLVGTQTAMLSKAVITQGAICARCSAWKGSLGLEPTPELYVAHLVEIFREVRRVLRKDGVVWLNMGDGYAGGHVTYSDKRWQHGAGPNRNMHTLGGPGLKPKDLIGMPWRVAFALQADGWWLRSDIIWAKPNPMPQSVRDRPTRSHEYVFLLSKRGRYYMDMEAIREAHQRGYAGSRFDIGKTGVNGNGRVQQGERTQASGRNRRSVWTIPTQPYLGAHFATFPEALVEPCIKAGSSERGCCPKCGAPWARQTKRRVHFEGGSGKAGRTAAEVNSRGKYHGDDGENIKLGPVVDVETIGWRPTCACDAGEPVPCLVVDPFAGSGTTGVVALRLGQSFIGIDLSGEYCEMARARIVDDAPLFNNPLGAVTGG